MKYFKKAVFALTLLLLMLGTVGCKKKYCYYCYAFAGGFTAHKGGSYVSVGQISERVWLQDSVNIYVNFGYTIDTVLGGYFPDPPGGNEVCDTNSVDITTAHDSCVAVI